MDDRGIFITLEGGEGAGKSTQIRLLEQALTGAGIPVVATREPGGTPEAETIRGLLVRRDGAQYAPMTEMLLLSAARHEHIVKKIRPALCAGTWVVSDRFIDSTRAMQGAGMGLDRAAIDAVYRIIAGDLFPDLTFILDLPPETGLERSLRRLRKTAGGGAAEDKYERMDLGFHERLRAGFLGIAREEPGRCAVIDARQDPQAVHADIVRVVEERCRLRLKEAKYG